jgi:hypothetical protein
MSASSSCFTTLCGSTSFANTGATGTVTVTSLSTGVPQTGVLPAGAAADTAASTAL